MPIFCLMGPTACGKTKLALNLAECFSSELISVDSAQVYKGLNIGSAKPTRDVLSTYPHRLIDICDPSESYSAGQFVTDAKREIADILGEQRIPLLVGGTMMYYRSLLFGIADLPESDSNIREELKEEAETEGMVAMHQRLGSVDPEAAERIHPNDPQRIFRALEVYQITGKPISSFYHFDTLQDLGSPIIMMGLIPENRELLHERISRRFNAMLDTGLVEEVAKLRERANIHADLPAMRAVGYRQVWEYLDGEYDHETMVEKAITATRQLAKRQITWLRSWPNLTVFHPESPQILEQILYRIQQQNLAK